MNKRIFTILIFALLVFPFSVKAICTNSKKAQYMAMANNITTAYTFDESTKKFTIYLSNIPKGFIVKDVAHDKIYEYTEQELVFNGYKPGESYKFEISMDRDCMDGPLLPIYVTLPMYNINYEDPICKRYEDYDICQKWGKYIENHDALEKEIKSINEIKDAESTVSSYEYKGIFSGLAKVFTKTYYVILPIIIIAGLVGIYVLNKKEKLF